MLIMYLNVPSKMIHLILTVLVARLAAGPLALRSRQVAQRSWLVLSAAGSRHVDLKNGQPGLGATHEAN